MRRNTMFKLALCVEAKLKYQCRSQLYSTWKLSNARCGILSSNSFIASHGPSPTPTRMIERGYSLHTIFDQIDH